jgi:TonB family protein
VFEPSGKLLRTGTGFFVSEDGRFITSRSIVDGGANAVAKTSDGKIYNVLGILAEAGPPDVAVMQAEIKQRVPFARPNKDAVAQPGTHIAAIGSPLNRRESRMTETTISKPSSDANGDWLELPASVPTESLGAPVVNENGDVLGLVTLQRGPGTAANVVRMAAALDLVLAKVDPRTKPGWLAQAAEPAPPADGPKKAPVATMGRPGANSRLVYSPTPQYPVAARHSYFPLKGSGRYRVTFGSNGQVRDVQVIQSTRSESLDSAAVEALRHWKAPPGQAWEANVPITFAP